MQAKGLIKAFVIALIIVCLYQLSFSFLAKRVESKADDVAKAKVAALKDFDKLSPDSVKTLTQEEKTRYLDSLSVAPVYDLGLAKITYRDLLQYQINLGLDLQGGMSVVLQVSVEDLLKAMSNDSKDPKFIGALADARTAQNTSGDDYITLFADAFQKRAGNKSSMSAIFGTLQNEKTIKFGDPDDKVITELRRSAEAAVDQTYNIVRTRIDGLGVANPNISKQPSTDRIIIELPGIDNPERARKLLQSTAKLEFWDTYDRYEVFQYLEEANVVLSQKLGLTDSNDAKADSAKTAGTETAPATEVAGKDSTTATSDSNELFAAKDTGLSGLLTEDGETAGTDSNEILRRKYPLYALMQPNYAQQGEDDRDRKVPQVGFAHKSKKSQIDEYLGYQEVKDVLPKDLRLFWSAKPGANGVYELYAVRSSADDKAALSGDVIEDAKDDLGQSGGYEVSMSMNDEGAAVWSKLTLENSQQKRSIAVVLDNQVLTAPVPNGQIPNGSSVITGNFSADEAKDLASVIKAGKLPAPANIVEEAVVGPTLGQESINSGFLSLVIGFVAVVLFMLFYYNNAGIIANLALLLNLLFIAGALASLQAALTLPGMAGILLTIGMAVDANVVIFERIREELERGKGLKLAVADGYSKSYSAIIDANVTTFFTGLILLFFGLGPVKGFAIILVIGIVSSMITAVLVSRLIMDRATSKDLAIKFSTGLTKGAFKNININFIGRRKITYAISAVLIVIGLVSMFTKGFELGVDFTGGRTYDIVFDQKANTTEIAASLTQQFENKAPVVKTFGSENQVRITTAYKIEEPGKEIDSLVEVKLYDGLKKFYDPSLTFEQFHTTKKLQSSKVGAAIADDILTTSLTAGAIAIAFIFLYIFVRFRKFQYGVGAIVATLHDVFIMLTVFSLLAGILPFSMEIDQHFIAAILTIIGYSINDTVIVFDRIREYFRDHPSKDVKTLANMAINDTLSRTIMTSFITFMVVTILFIFGGEMIRGFSFALMVGILIGTYSSIFIAAPVVIDLAKDEKDLKS